jgi:hypothetical protein
VSAEILADFLTPVGAFSDIHRQDFSQYFQGIYVQASESSSHSAGFPGVGINSTTHKKINSSMIGEFPSCNPN